MITDDRVREHICEFCDSLRERLLDKFNRGRMEHGDDLSTLDVSREIEEELVDIHIYRIIEKLQKED